MRSFRRALCLGLTAIALAACATLPPPSPIAALDQFHIASVEVAGSDTIRSWPVEEEAYIKRRALDAEAAAHIRTTPVGENPELAAHIKSVLTEVFKADFATEMATVLAGPRPVKAVVHLKRFDVPSLARRMFTDQIATIVATVTLVEPNGTVVITSPELPAAIPLLGGLSSPVAAMVESSKEYLDPGRTLVKDLIVRFRTWLFPK